MGHALGTPTRREQLRQATYDDIVRASVELLQEGAELSLRAVAARMGMTAPALYRYVGSYQELVDLVAFELDKAATRRLAAAAEKHPADDPAARLTVASVEFRRWALEHPREFSLVFANPVAGGETDRRETLTVSNSGHFFTDLLYQIWQLHDFPIPALDELHPAVREAVLDPLIPAKADRIAPEDRGLLWIYMRSWSSLYGVVTLESTGHCDPRVIESGALFRATMMEWLEPLGLGADRDRLIALMDAELAE